MSKSVNGLLVLGVAVFLGFKFSLPVFDVHPKGAILITGASSGIGLDAAKELIKQGYTVFGTVRNQAAFADLQTFGATPVIMDVQDEASILKVLATIQSWMNVTKQPFVALVNNAGISISMPVELISIEATRDLFEVNVFALIRVSQLALPLLRDSHGRIVNIGSIAGIMAAPFHGPYAATKHAVEAISDSMRCELAPLGVSVSLIEPGYVMTNIMEKSITAEAPHRHSNADQMAVYPLFFETFESQRRSVFANAPYPNASTTPAIVDAITSPTPAERYVVAGLGDGSWIPARVSLFIVSLLPTHIRDMLVKSKSGFKK